ncbi:hypothetical protein L596_025953 [Steinernema carpocapsae]|uniref:Uncharacterized protein n=1 Tax=Steinernema carpocapsae TaxID=34508 RepID=A0A4U5M9A5_STECR|nr:hypothetical protein L596_025953 [Steinernema carpocapsae]
MVFNAATRAVFTVGKQANGRLTLESVENISKTQYDSAYKIVKVRFRVDTTVYYGQQHHGCFRKSDVILIIGDHPHINVFRYLKMHTIFRFGIRVRNVTVEKDELEELHKHCDPTCNSAVGTTETTFVTTDVLSNFEIDALAP